MEFELGQIETQLAPSTEAEQQWDGTLATFTVDTTADTEDANPGDGIAEDSAGNVSLRAAIMEANALAGDDVIVLDAATTYLLTLTGDGENQAETGDLDVDSTIRIVGADAATTIIDAGGIDRVFHVRSGGDLTLENVTVQGGAVDAGGSNGRGGGVFIETGELSLDRVIVTNNEAREGGGIYNADTLQAVDVVIAGNDTVSGPQEGGGLLNDGTADLARVTISGNSADTGGGTYNGRGGSGELTVTNVTVSGHSATGDRGGGIFNNSDLTLQSVTIADNNASDSGGGIYNDSSGSVTLGNSVIGDNTDGNEDPDFFADSSGNVTSDGVSLIEIAPNDTASFTGGFVTGDADLAALADNGGFGFTHALNLGSVAIGAANVGTAPAVDQRNFDRDGAPDLGAFEFGATEANQSPTGTVTIDNTTPAEDDVLTASNSLADADGLGAITYTWRAGATVVGTGTTYTATQADVGETITVAASYTDGQGTAASVTSAPTAAVPTVHDAAPGAATTHTPTPAEAAGLTPLNTTRQ